MSLSTYVVASLSTQVFSQLIAENKILGSVPYTILGSVPYVCILHPK
jgi:hypothetical protein